MVVEHAIERVSRQLLGLSVVGATMSGPTKPPRILSIGPQVGEKDGSRTKWDLTLRSELDTRLSNLDHITGGRVAQEGPEMDDE
jgi:hypothetical protein